MTDMQEAVEKVRLGPERRSRVITEEEKEIVAYHEAGHALVAYRIPEADPVHKISIIARGGAGGFTMFLPKDDQTLISRAQFKAYLAVNLGGRAAEEIMYNKNVTTGASGDLETVTKLARAMVTQYGMSKKLGPLTFGDKEELIFLGRQISEQRNYSEEVAEQIDFEVRELVEEAHQRALQILQDNIDTLHLIAQRLIDEETLDAEEFATIFADGDKSALEDTPSPVDATSAGETKDTPPRRMPPSTAPLPA
jgi:cell division protease FtsH